jgi:transposase-like protein
MNDIDKINDNKCPACKGVKVQKYGRTKTGVQKYRCLNLGCRRQFVGASDRPVDPDTKDKIIKLLSENVHPKIIHKTFSDSISLRWIYELRRRMKIKI